MITYSSNCLISQEWLASIAEGNSIINATLLYFTIIIILNYSITFCGESTCNAGIRDNSLPSTLYIDQDEGLEAIDDPRAHIWVIRIFWNLLIKK